MNGKIENCGHLTSQSYYTNVFPLLQFIYSIYNITYKSTVFDNACNKGLELVP